MLLHASLTQSPSTFPLPPSWQLMEFDHFPSCTVPEQSELDQLSGILDPVDPLEVIRVYGPWVKQLCQEFQSHSLKEPLFIGITGSVCSGKTTTARVLHYLFAQEFGEEATTLLTLDNFLKPNAEIARTCPGGMLSKGFPVTFHFEQLIATLTAISNGSSVNIPCYDHIHYDIHEDQFRTIAANQKIVIVEGIIAAQDTPKNMSHRFNKNIRDFCRTMIFVQTYNDAAVLPQWFEERLVLFGESVRKQRSGHLAHRYAQQLAQFDHDIARGLPFLQAKHCFEQAIRCDARRIWANTNGPNYEQFIAPSRQNCDTVVIKMPDHHIGGVYTRHALSDS